MVTFSLTKLSASQTVEPGDKNESESVAEIDTVHIHLLDLVVGGM